MLIQCPLLLLCGILGTSAVSAHAQPQQLLQQLNDAFTNVVSRVKPGVVAVSTTSKVDSFAGLRGTPFERYFRPPQQSDPDGQLRRGQGSGFIIRHLGEQYIMTNNHVVAGAEEITVELGDERIFEASIVGADSLSDLAILRVEEDDLPALSLGDSDELRVGEWVLAVGNPFRLEHSVTSGIVSALGRGRFGGEYGSYIQTDAAVNPGNSGGPLVNMRGEVVGVNSAIVSRAGGYDGISFAIPVNLAQDVLAQLVEHGEVKRGVLGVEIGDVDRDLAEALGMEDTRGVIVKRVIPGLPADVAGIEQGDVLLSIDGTEMKGVVQLRNKIGQTPPGTQVRLGILRRREEKSVTVELGQLTAATFGRDPGGAAVAVGLGLEIQELSVDLARRLGYKDGNGVVVVQVQRGGEAARRGLRRGDLIVEVNQQQVDSVKDYERALEGAEAGASILFLVQRGDDSRFVALRMPSD